MPRGGHETAESSLLLTVKRQIVATLSVRRNIIILTEVKLMLLLLYNNIVFYVTVSR